MGDKVVVSIWNRLVPGSALMLPDDCFETDKGNVALAQGQLEFRVWSTNENHLY